MEEKKRKKESLVLITHTQTQIYTHNLTFSLAFTHLHAHSGHVDVLGTTELTHKQTHTRCTFVVHPHNKQMLTMNLIPVCLCLGN